jgi:hypothetical protein
MFTFIVKTELSLSTEIINYTDLTAGSNNVMILSILISSNNI